MTDKVLYETDGEIAILTINRYEEARNAVDADVAAGLTEAFRRFEQDSGLKVAILTGAGGVFCAGADLKQAAGRAAAQPAGPGWPTREIPIVAKPTIAAVEGFAVAGGLELSLYCDLRVAARDAVFGVFCRRWGIPLVDGGTVRLPRVVGHGHALDLILTGRGVSGEEALRMGLVNRLTETGDALAVALEIARQIAQFPQECMLSDRRSAYEQWNLTLEDALRNEQRLGRELVETVGIRAGAARFASGAGRHGTLADGSRL